MAPVRPIVNGQIDSAQESGQAGLGNGLALPLIREMILSSLEKIEGMRGQYSVGGVTIAALQPLKPMPFRIVYILGMGEDNFPGSNVLSGLDLRGLQRCPAISGRPNSIAICFWKHCW